MKIVTKKQWGKDGTYFCTSSDPTTLMKQASVRLAHARADSVLPVPGGPYLQEIETDVVFLK